MIYVLFLHEKDVLSQSVTMDYAKTKRSDAYIFQIIQVPG